jgi:hypothetical protein
MKMHRNYYVCRNHIGKAVTIRTVDGRSYHGKVTNVTQEEVHISSLGMGINGEQQSIKKLASNANANEEQLQQLGEGIFFFAPFIIPLAAIAGITLIGTAPFWGRYGWYGGPRRFY